MKNQVNSFKFFENEDCQWYPCHNDMDTINCLFCFCPLYNHDCYSEFQTMKDGIKDCSSCKYPHYPEYYDQIIRWLKDLNDEKRK